MSRVVNIYSFVSKTDLLILLRLLAIVIFFPHSFLEKTIQTLVNMGKYNCSVPGCKTGNVSQSKKPKNERFSLFTARSVEQLEKWRKAISRSDKELSLQDTVCSLHFTEECIDKYFETVLPDGTVWKLEKGRHQIKEDAVPTIFPNLPSHFSKVSDKRKIPAQSQSNVEKKKKINYEEANAEMVINGFVMGMRKRSCSVPGCKTTSKSEAKKPKNERRSVFTAQSVEQLEKWRRAIPRCNKEFSFQDTVCSLHFTEECIDKYFETVLSDGTVWKCEKGRRRIKEDAVPTIFPNLPSHFSKVSKKRKTSDQRKSNVEETEKKVNYEEAEAEVMINEDAEEFTFNTLISNLESVSKPNVLWGITVHDTFVMCAKWNEDCKFEKAVAVHPELNVKVFLRDREIELQNCSITNIYDLSSILQRVDNCRMCLGVNDMKNTGCHLFLIKESRSDFCESCRTIRNKEASRNRSRKAYAAKKRSRIYVNKRETLCGQIRNMKRKNLHLTGKNLEKLEKWCRVIPKSDRVLRLDDKVYSLHFTEECVDEYEETPLQDSTVWKMKKDQPSIKENVIPTISSDLSSYLSKATKERKPPDQRDSSIERTINCEEAKMDIEKTYKRFTFSELVNSLESVLKSNASWEITVHDTFVVCSKRGTNCKLEKKVVIHSTLNVQVFLEDKEIHFQNPFFIHDVSDLSSILREVGGYVICLGLSDIENPECHLFRPDNSGSLLCRSCQLVQNKEVYRTGQREVYAAKKNKNLYIQHINCT